VSYQWSEKGEQPKVMCKQRGRERETAMGSYNFETGQTTVTFHKKGNYQSFRKHLKKILWVYRAHSKIELVYLAPYSPELNPVERAWWYMRKKITHNRYVKSLEERKIAFWKMFSHFQKPNEELKNICVINY